MSTDIELRGDAPPALQFSERETWANELMAWAAAAQKAHEIALVLSETSFVPKSMQHRPGDVTGAILTGMELGVPIMWALSNIDIVDGSPAIRAKALRGLLKRNGHEIWVEESTATRAIVCARHKDSPRIERSVWTLDRAKKAELLRKKNWQLYPQDMLLNRATAEAARLAAPDVLLGYTVDELGGDETLQHEVADDDTKPAPKKRTAQRAKPELPVGEGLPADIPVPPDKAAAAPPAEKVEPEPHLGGELPGTCDLNMPHDIRGVEYGCPPNCPTRKAEAPPADEVMASVSGLGMVDVQLPDDDMPPDEQAIEAMDGEPEPEPMVSDGQRKRMAVEMRKAGIVDRDERLRFVSDIVGREIQSGNDLTMAEASRVIDAVIDYATERGLDAVQPTEGDDE